jgi:hypothetical protein
MILNKMITMAMATGAFFEFGPRRVLLLRFLGNPGFGSTPSALLHPGKDNGRLFHDQIILYGFDPFDAAGDFTRFIDGLLGINEAAQLNDALVSFDTDLEGLEKIISGQLGLYLRRDDRIVHVFPGTFLFGCRGTGHQGGDQHQKHKTADKHISLFHSSYSFLLVCGEWVDYENFSTEGIVDSTKSFRTC